MTHVRGRGRGKLAAHGAARTFCAFWQSRWVTRGSGYAPHTDTLVCRQRHTLKPHAHTQPESARTHNSQLRTYTDTRVCIICISSFEAHWLIIYGTRPEWAAGGGKQPSRLAHLPDRHRVLALQLVDPLESRLRG